MSLRPRKPSETAAAAFAPIVSVGAQTALAAEKAASAVDASWWQRRERVRQQPLPRLQLYNFDTSQANDELYAFLYDRKEVRHFFSQSRLNGTRMGELEAVEGYGRADIMAIAWTRKGGADFEVRFIGHNDISLAEGYTLKSDIMGKYTWVLKLTRLYGEHIMSLTSRTLFSLPTYTALATGLKFGLDDPMGGYGTVDVSSSIDRIDAGIANLTVQETPVASAVKGISSVNLPPAMKPAHAPGRCEVGSFFHTQQTLAAGRGEKVRRGDKWTIVRPADNNPTIGGVASFQRYNPSKGAEGSGMRAVPQSDGTPVGVIFPTRGTPECGMGKFVHRVEIEAVPIPSLLGAAAAHPISAYRATLYNNDIGAVVGVADIIPDARRSKDGKTMSAERFFATPCVGKTWVSEGADMITIDSTDVKRCKEGDVCPWSVDLVCVIETGIHKLETGVQ